MNTHPTAPPSAPIWVRLTEFRAGRTIALVERAENIVRFRSEPDGQTLVELRDAAPVRVVESVEAVLNQLRPAAPSPARTRRPNPTPK